MPADTHRQCKNIYRCFGILDSEYMVIAVESVEMGVGRGEGGRGGEGWEGGVGGGVGDRLTE